MLKEERHKKIIELLEKSELVTVSKISKILNVSEMTVRRDLNQLEEEKKLIKIHGGAKRLPVVELTTNEKINNFVQEKKEIGLIMNKLIPDNSVIYLGAGTTIYYALSSINKKNLFIITNSLIAFNYLIENTDYKIILTGGELNKNTEEFIGNVTEAAFENLNIDIAFAATNGIIDNNITTSSSLQGSVQTAAFNKSKIKCIVADSSKLNKSDVYTFYKLSQINYLITDSKINNSNYNKYSKYTKIIKE